MNTKKITNSFNIDLNQIKKIWINNFPIEELPDEYTKLVVKTYRNGNCSEITALQGLNRREKMLEEWFNIQIDICEELGIDNIFN